MHPRDLINAVKQLTPEERNEFLGLLLDSPPRDNAAPVTIRTQADTGPAPSPAPAPARETRGK